MTFKNITVKLPTIFHRIEDNNKLKSQKKAERMRIIILTGSDAIVMRNKDRAGPYAVRAQPKNVKAVILILTGNLQLTWGYSDLEK